VSRRASGDHPKFKAYWGNNLNIVMDEISKPPSTRHTMGCTTLKNLSRLQSNLMFGISSRDFIFSRRYTFL